MYIFSVSVGVFEGMEKPQADQYVPLPLPLKADYCGGGKAVAAVSAALWRNT